MITLKAEKRNPNVKAKKLRREGYVTGILSGKEMKEPVALQFDGAEAAKFIKANKKVHRSIWTSKARKLMPW